MTKISMLAKVAESYLSVKQATEWDQLKREQYTGWN